MVRTLEKSGYILVNWSYWNTHLVHRSAMIENPRLSDWVKSWYCSSCDAYGAVPFYSNGQGIFCQPCIRSFYAVEHRRYDEKESVDPVSLKPGYEDGQCVSVKSAPGKSAKKQQLDMEPEHASKRLKTIPG